MSEASTKPEKLAAHGGVGEKFLQQQYGTADRAAAFYRNQMLDHLSDRMQLFVDKMEMMFVSTAAADGSCDCSIRCGLPGFVHRFGDRQLCYPEYRGNGVMASLGNISENPNVGLLFVDFLDDCIGLHVNGRAALVDTAELLVHPQATDRLRADCERRGGRRPERWVRVDIDEAYIHCAKHLPKLAKVPKKIQWGTDDPAAKGGDYFGASASEGK